MAVRTLYDAWRDKGDPGFPFHGVPWHLYSDQTGALKAGPAQALFDNLFVTWVGHMPRRPTATGLAERRIQACQKWETVIRGRQAFGYPFGLKEFNSWLYEWCVDENNRAWRGPTRTSTDEHGRTQTRKLTRFQAWATISDESIRRCPEWDDFVRLSAAGEDTRRVSQYMSIQWDNESLYLGSAAVEVIGEKVHVYRMADGQMFAKHGGRVFGPLKDRPPVNVMGVDYEQPRLTESERNLRAARAAAVGIGMKAKDMAHQRDPESEMFVPREGRRIEIEGTEGTQGTKGAVKTALAAKDWLVGRCGSLAGLDWEAMAALERTIDGLLEDCGEITEAELEEIAKAVESERGGGESDGLDGAGVSVEAGKSREE